MGNIIQGITKDLKNIPKTIKSKTKSLEPKKVILKVLPYAIFGYVADKFYYGYRITEGSDTLNRLTDSLASNAAFQNPMPSFHPMDLLIGVAFGVGMRLIVYFKAKNAKKFRHGEEYGSARWGTPKDIEPYMDKENFENNILLTQTERLQMNGRSSSPKYARNKNVLIIGGSGSGKTRFFVKPNLMQLHSSYVCTDPNNAVVFDDDYYVTSGTISTVGGYRWYAFQTEAETKVTALMVMNQTMDADFYLYKLNEDTMQLEFVNGSAVDGAGEMEYYTDIIGEGVYFIGINGYSGTGIFTFAFYKCTYDALAEFNDTLASAIDVTYGQQYSGVIDNPMDHDFYTLTLSEPTIIKYNFSSSLNYSLKWFDTSIGDFSDAVYFTDGPAEYFKLSVGTHYFAVRTTDSDIFSSTVPYYLTFTKVGTYSGNSNLYIKGINEETGIILESTAAPGNNMITNYVNGHPIDISYSLNQNYSNSAGGQNYNISINANAGAYISMYEGKKPEIAYYYGSTRPAMSVSNRNVLKLTYRCNSNFYRINCFCTGAYAMNNYSQTYNYVTVIIDPEIGKLIDIVEFNYYYDFAPVGSNYITCPSIYPMTLFY